jgi:hypothetical protein
MRSRRRRRKTAQHSGPPVSKAPADPGATMKAHRSTHAKVSRTREQQLRSRHRTREPPGRDHRHRGARPRRGGGGRRTAGAGDRSPARSVRPDPGTHHEGIGASERIASLRERAGHRARRADGGTSEGGRRLSSGSVAALPLANATLQTSPHGERDARNLLRSSPEIPTNLNPQKERWHGAQGCERGVRRPWPASGGPGQRPAILVSVR